MSIPLNCARLGPRAAGAAVGAGDRRPGRRRRGRRCPSSRRTPPGGGRRGSACGSDWHSISGSVNVATWPEASQVWRGRITEESRPTTSSRLLDHRAPPLALDVLLELDAERAVVPGGPGAAVDLAAREDEAPALAEADDGVDGGGWLLGHAAQAIGARRLRDRSRGRRARPRAAGRPVDRSRRLGARGPERPCASPSSTPPAACSTRLSALAPRPSPFARRRSPCCVVGVLVPRPWRRRVASSAWPPSSWRGCVYLTWPRLDAARAADARAPCSLLDRRARRPSCQARPARPLDGRF